MCEKYERKKEKKKERKIYTHNLKARIFTNRSLKLASVISKLNQSKGSNHSRSTAILVHQLRTVSFAMELPTNSPCVKKLTTNNILIRRRATLSGLDTRGILRFRLRATLEFVFSNWGGSVFWILYKI